MDPLTLALQSRYPADPPGFAVGDFLFKHSSPLCALLHAQLFWPEFVVLDDMVFWVGQVEESPDRRASVVRHYRGDLTQSEISFNFIDIPELFTDDPDDLPEVLWRDLAGILCDCWKARLKSLFPERQFKVEVIETGPKEGSTIGIQFYQLR